MRNQIIALASLILLSVCNTGCKEDTIIKANVTPSSDFILSDNKIGDTLTIYTKTVIDDSIAIRFNTGAGDIYGGIGTLYDRYFGRTNWGMYFQVVPTAGNIILPNNPDSAVLVIPYVNFSWGDTSVSGTHNERFKVYLVTEDMSKDVAYNTKTSFNVDWANPIGDAVVDIYKLRTNDSITVAGAKRMPHLRIKLTNAFRDKLYNAGKSSATAADFLGQIKGIYIESGDTASNSITNVPFFRFNGTADYQRASLALYYNDNNPTNDPAKVSTAFFNFTSNDCAHNNYIRRNYSVAAGGDITKYLYSTALSDSIMFMQNEPGAAFDLRIPNIKNLPTGIINKAQLVITRVSYSPDAEDTKYFTAPPRLYPVGIDTANGGTYTIADRYPVENAGALEFIDGNKREVTLPNGITVTQYYINIPREVQKAITNKASELHLRINGTVTYPGAFRIIAGGKHSTYKTRLNIVYTKIN